MRDYTKAISKFSESLSPDFKRRVEQLRSKVSPGQYLERDGIDTEDVWKPPVLNPVMSAPSASLVKETMVEVVPPPGSSIKKETTESMSSGSPFGSEEEDDMMDDEEDAMEEASAPRHSTGQPKFSEVRKGAHGGMMVGPGKAASMGLDMSMEMLSRLAGIVPVSGGAPAAPSNMGATAETYQPGTSYQRTDVPVAPVSAPASPADAYLQSSGTSYGNLISNAERDRPLPTSTPPAVSPQMSPWMQSMMEVQKADVPNNAIPVPGLNTEAFAPRQLKTVPVPELNTEAFAPRQLKTVPVPDVNANAFFRGTDPAMSQAVMEISKKNPSMTLPQIVEVLRGLLQQGGR